MYQSRQNRRQFLTSAAGGILAATRVDAEGKPLSAYTRGNCRPCRDDSTCARISWNGVTDLGRLRGRPFSLRFHAARAKLFSFWISPDESGASHGYVAAGGPGFTGPTDTVGTSRN